MNVLVPLFPSPGFRLQTLDFGYQPGFHREQRCSPQVAMVTDQLKFRHPMPLQLKPILPVILAVATLALHGAETHATGENYFRFDGGVAREPGSLPDDFDA